MKLGILTAHYGCVNDEILDRVLRGLRFENLEIVCDADGLGKPVRDWCVRRGLPFRCIAPPPAFCGGFLPPACGGEAFARYCDLVVLFWDGRTRNGREAAAHCRINGTPCAVAVPFTMPCRREKLYWRRGQVVCHAVPESGKP